MRRCSRVSSPLVALALLLLICLFHCAAAARPLPVPVQENGAKVAADDEPPVIQKDAAASGDELPSPSVAEAADEEAEEPAACEEGNVDECLQRRLLHDAHLDYIYTQHKGKP